MLGLRAAMFASSSFFQSGIVPWHCLRSDLLARNVLRALPKAALNCPGRELWVYVEVLMCFKHECLLTSMLLPHPLHVQVMHFLSCQAIDKPALPSWTPLEAHPHGSRPSSRRGSRSDPHPATPDALSGGGSESGQPSKRQRAGNGSGGKAVTTCASSDHPGDQLPEHDQLPDSQGAADEQCAAASVLSKAAAGLSHRAVEKVIGYGISGPVFMHR